MPRSFVEIRRDSNLRPDSDGLAGNLERAELSEEEVACCDERTDQQERARMPCRQSE